MSGRRAANRIRGPQSALTDFLAANNISAQQIRDSYEQRNRQAEQQNAAEGARTRSQVATRTQRNNDEEDDDDDEVEEPQPQRKRKRHGEAPKPKPKDKASLKKKKKRHDSDYDSADDWVEASLYKKANPKPGQLENCEVCDKRFTVTAYSKTGPQGGLVCTSCGKELAKDAPDSTKKPKRAAPGKARRKLESNRLDGIGRGPKSLRQLCIEKVADHHLDIEEFGDLPATVLHRLSQIFSKRRVMNPRTVQLFLRPDLDTVAIHDAANLEADDFKQIFAVVPDIKSLILGNACQFKDSVLDYMMERATQLTHFHVDAANLVTNDKWVAFFLARGIKLESLKLSWLDAAFDDDVVETMVAQCPNITRLKLKACRKLTSASLLHIGNLQKLEHLSLELSQSATPEELVHLIASIGRKLKTLSLENCVEADDTVINSIHSGCPDLIKFRLNNIDQVTDNALVLLFTPPSAVSSLEYVDLSSARDVDNNNPDGPLDAPIGLASHSFKSLMANAGKRLRVLKIASCRHISHDTFWEVFVQNHSSTANLKDGSKKKSRTDDAEEQDPSAPPPFEFPVSYPALKELNISFCNSVDTPVINGIFKCCPNLKKLIAFGCFRIEDVTVPKGVSLIGVPRAQDAIEQFGGSLDGLVSSMPLHPVRRLVEVEG